MRNDDSTSHGEDDAAITISWRAPRHDARLSVAAAPEPEAADDPEADDRERARKVAMWRAAVRGVTTIAELDEAVDPADHDRRMAGDTANWLFPARAARR